MNNEKTVRLLDGLANILLICGFISAFALAFFMGRTSDLDYFRASYERNWGLTIAIFLGVVFVSVLQYAVLEALSRILGTLDSISNYTRKSASIVSRQDENEQKEKAVETGNMWKCTSCGRINEKYITTCACGQNKFNN